MSLGLLGSFCVALHSVQGAEDGAIASCRGHLEILDREVSSLS